MNLLPMPDNLNVLTLSSIFLLMLSIWVGILFVWLIRRGSRLKKIQTRLGIADENVEIQRVLRLWHGQDSTTITVPVISKRPSWAQRLNQITTDAGLGLPVQWGIAGIISASLFAFILIYLYGKNILLAVAAAITIPLIYYGYVKHKMAKRDSLFEQQLVDSMQIAARSLRAGHPLVGAFHLIAEEIQDPLRSVFARITQQQALGVSMEQSIRDAANEVRSQDFKLFATAVRINLHSGGNLADLMDSLAGIIRARMRISRRARILTAQTQFSKRVLIVLPFLIFLVLNLINPRYMEPLYTTSLGRIMLGIIACNMLMGIWIMNKIAVLRY